MCVLGTRVLGTRVLGTRVLGTRVLGTRVSPGISHMPFYLCHVVPTLPSLTTADHSDKDLDYLMGLVDNDEPRIQ